jgi:hypothetical protein
MRRANLRLLTAALLLCGPELLEAQRVTMPADPGHAASPFYRMLFGDGYRDVWAVPITVPVLDLDNFEGGLTAFQEGGNQSRTLRLRAANGKVYQFRSTRKFFPRAMPDDLRDTPAGKLIHDQSAAMHPTGHLVVSGLEVATGVLHPVPQLYVLPDNPRLGKFRKDFAGMMGQLEERPQDYDDKKEMNFGGAEKIIDADDLIEKLEAGMEDRFDARDYLRARLIDILVGDTDRGGDQWQFARFEAGDRDVYRSIPRDRDYAFMNSDGLLIRLVGMAYPKLVLYREQFAKLNGYLFMTREFDRTHLSELGWADWQALITELQSHLTDRIIDNAVMRMPPEHRQLSGPHFATALKARRDQLPDYAREFYFWVNEEAVVFASDERERAEIDRHQDGSVTVRIYREGEGGEVAGTNGTHRPAWERRFLPGETTEIRVFLERGNDHAIVRGGAPRTIDVRVVGGEGDDVLIDSTTTSGNETFTTFYDAHGNNTIVTGPHTRVSLAPYVSPQPVEGGGDAGKPKSSNRVLHEERRGRFQDLMNAGAGFIESKTTAEWIRDWGQKNGVSPAFGLREGSGLIVGGGFNRTDFGFRRVPYETRFDITGLVSPTTGRLGAQFFWDRHPENSRFGYGVTMNGSQFEANRFFGWGNDSPFDDVSGSLVRRNEVFIHPAVSYSGDHHFLSFGPIARWSDPVLQSGSVADTIGNGSCGFSPLCGFGLGGEPQTMVGAHVQFSLSTTEGSATPISGFTLSSAVTGFAKELDCAESEPCVPSHATVDVTAATYVSIGSPVLGLRVGGSKVFGDGFPLQDASFIGGLGSLRGYRWNRFVGDAALFGGAELRIPITRVVLFTRGTFGILALADAGRVWFEGDSPGGWHTGFGGGLWFHTIGQTVSVQYAQGEDEGRFYFKMGAPF